MGRDKFENEELSEFCELRTIVNDINNNLVKYGIETDVWFHGTWSRQREVF